MQTASLAALEAAVTRDLALVGYPLGAWSPAHAHDGAPVLDVLIAGGGQGGLTIAGHLLRAQLGNILVVDDSEAGEEGIWCRFARMKTLRTGKTVTGPDLGIPSLTFQSWFEVQHGAAAFAALGKIDKEDWQSYLGWITRMLAIPVANRTRFLGVEPAGPYLKARLADDSGERTVLTRKLVLALGIETSGQWWMPPEIAALPGHLRAHTSHAIDFAALKGRDVVVIGAGASAFDNAATALEAGAANVTLLCRRPDLQRVQPYKIIAHPGFLGHFGALPDATRWRLATHLLSIREAFPAETWERTTRHANFRLLTGAPIRAAHAEGGRVTLATARGDVSADFVIAGTGFDTDLRLRPELAVAADRIATWGDRYTPAPEARNDRVARYPYLDPGMAFTPKDPADGWISNIHCFNFGATASFGPSGSSISAMKFAAPRVANAIVRDLFVADAEHHAHVLTTYDTPEFDLDPTR